MFPLVRLVKSIHSRCSAPAIIIVSIQDVPSDGTSSGFAHVNASFQRQYSLLPLWWNWSFGLFRLFSSLWAKGSKNEWLWCDILMNQLLKPCRKLNELDLLRQPTHASRATTKTEVLWSSATVVYPEDDYLTSTRDLLARTQNSTMPIVERQKTWEYSAVQLFALMESKSCTTHCDWRRFKWCTFNIRPFSAFRRTVLCIFSQF